MKHILAVVAVTILQIGLHLVFGNETGPLVGAMLIAIGIHLLVCILFFLPKKP